MHHHRRLHRITTIRNAIQIARSIVWAASSDIFWNHHYHWYIAGSSNLRLAVALLDSIKRVPWKRVPRSIWRNCSPVRCESPS